MRRHCIYSDRVHAKGEPLCRSGWTADHRVTVRLSDDMLQNKCMKCVDN